MRIPKLKPARIEFTPATAYPIVNSDYFSATRQFIDQAKTSVDILFFAARYYTGQSHHPVNKFFNSLRQAANRGIKIRLLFNANFFQGDSLTHNIAIIKHFKSPNLDAALAGKSTRLHSKMIIVDNQITILGSHNHSVRAFSGNFETSIAVHSPAIAATYTDHFTRLWRSRQIVERSNP